MQQDRRQLDAVAGLHRNSKIQKIAEAHRDALQAAYPEPEPLPLSEGCVSAKGPARRSGQT
jgi:hypothetical protein